MKLKEVKKWVIVFEFSEDYYQGKGCFIPSSQDYQDERGSNEMIDFEDLYKERNNINDIDVFNTEVDARAYVNNWNDYMRFYFDKYEDYKLAKVNCRIIRLCDLLEGR